jgi:integrase
VSAEANVKAVQKMLGHASAAMTLDVGKMWARAGSRVVDRLANRDLMRHGPHIAAELHV